MHIDVSGAGLFPTKKDAQFIQPRLAANNLRSNIVIVQAFAYLMDAQFPSRLITAHTSPWGLSAPPPPP
jgi:hypothetical protein